MRRSHEVAKARLGTIVIRQCFIEENQLPTDLGASCWELEKTPTLAINQSLVFLPITSTVQTRESAWNVLTILRIAMFVRVDQDVDLLAPVHGMLPCFRYPSVCAVCICLASSVCISTFWGLRVYHEAFVQDVFFPTRLSHPVPATWDHHIWLILVLRSVWQDYDYPRDTM